MRSILLYIISMSSFFACSQKPPIEDIEDQSASITSILEAQRIAWNNGDIETFMGSYWKSDSLTFIGSTGLKNGWQSTLDNYKIRYPDREAMGILNFEIIRLDIMNGTSAMMIGRYTLVRSSDTPTGLFTLIWKKINNQWVIVSDHTC
ncbi:MAG: nuclear transport factor 2 family protein [Saprospiraceae bacterium]